MIDSASSLDALVARLRSEPRVGIDTEADSLHSYREKLCLIQVGVPGDDVLVDPLAELDLTPLFSALADREVVVHGADYDLRMLFAAGHTDQQVVFDTMIAARLTGAKAFGYAALVEQHAGVKLGKGSQKANWGRRPLTPSMIEYARNDTRYLLLLAERLEAELVRLGRLGWLRQSCAQVLAATQVARERDEANAWRIAGSAELAPRQAAVLRALWQWREAEAAEVDRPTFHIMGNKELIGAAVALCAGRTPHTGRMRRARAERFQRAAEAALALPESEWPAREERGRPRARLTRAQEKRVAELRARRDAVAAELALEPTLIASRATLESAAADGDGDRLLPWQRDLLQL